MNKPSKADVLRVAGEPEAWIHESPDRVDVIHAKVKALLQSAGGFHRPLDKTEKYTIPAYTETKLLAVAAAMYAAGAESSASPMSHANALLTLAKWGVAPQKTAWGDGMMVADVMITKNDTLTMYVHKSVLALPVTQTNPEGETAERKDYCGSCGQWTGGPMVCCNERGNKPDVTKTEAIAVRLTRKERRNVER